MAPKESVWRAGEDAAAIAYRRRGFTIVARNWRCRAGEIDIVARRGGLVVFCEVKARASVGCGHPVEAVTAPKQARLRRLASLWLAERRPNMRSTRFDVASVIVRDGRAEVTLIPDAF